MIHKYFIFSLQLEDRKIFLRPVQRSYTGVVPLDKTVGLNTRLIFMYSHDVNSTIRTSGNHNIQITKNTDLQYIQAVVEGSAVSKKNVNKVVNRITTLCKFMVLYTHSVDLVTHAS